MRTVLVAVVFHAIWIASASAQTVADDLVGTWVMPGGDVIVFDADGTGYNATVEGERVEFTHAGETRGRVNLSGDGETTEYRYAVDGQSLLLGVLERNEWLMLRRTDLPVERLRDDPALLDALPEPFEDAAGTLETNRALRDLDDFAGVEEPADDRPAVEPADAAGVWLSVPPFEEAREMRFVLVARPDGSARYVVYNRGPGPGVNVLPVRIESRGPRTLTVAVDYNALGEQAGRDPGMRVPPRRLDDGLLRLVVTGETGLAISTGRRGEASFVPLVKSDLPPSEAVTQHLVRDTPTTRPAR